MDISKVKKSLTGGQICYVIDLGDYLGGAGNHLLRHAKLCNEQGLDIVVCIPSIAEGKKEIVEQICLRNKLKYCFADYSTAYDFSKINADNIRSSINAFIDLAQKNNIKLFHSVQLNPAVEMASRILGIPHIMSIYQISKASFEIGYPDIFAAFVHSDSILYSNIWAEGLKAQTTCIRSWIPDEFLRDSEEYSIKDIEQPFNFVMSGLLCERKSQHKVIEAVGRLKQQGYKINLYLLGNADPQADYVKSCEKIINQYEIQNQIFIKGFCKDVASELKSMDALICASNDESFPQAILEAMTMAIPVISTPVAGVPELIVNGESGYLSKDFSMESIMVVMKRFVTDCYQDKCKVLSIINNAKRIAEQECSREAVSRKLLQFYLSTFHEIKEYTEWERDINKLLLGYYQLDVKGLVETICSELSSSQQGQFVELFSSNVFGIFYKIQYLKRNYMSQKMKCFIWGAGNGGKYTKEIINALLPDFEIAGYIDKFKEGEYEGAKLYKPDEVKHQVFDYCFIASTPGKEEAISTLSKIGLKENINYISLMF